MPLKAKKLIWTQPDPNRNYWVADNKLGDCWIKKYSGTSVYNLYAPGAYGPGNNFECLEDAQNFCQDYLDKFLLELLSNEEI